MGCDIHLHVEVKINGEWLHYNQPKTARFYALFAKMAGVRNYDDEQTPIALPRGIPGDANKMTRFDFTIRRSSDAHSASWLSLTEIIELEVWWKENIKRIRFERSESFSDYFGYIFGNYYSSFREYPEEVPNGVEDVRFVFWFDN